MCEDASEVDAPLRLAFSVLLLVMELYLFLDFSLGTRRVLVRGHFALRHIFILKEVLRLKRGPALIKSLSSDKPMRLQACQG
jgi:hypothetical protein